MSRVISNNKLINHADKFLITRVLFTAKYILFIITLLERKIKQSEIRKKVNFAIMHMLIFSLLMHFMYHCTFCICICVNFV